LYAVPARVASAHVFAPALLELKELGGESDRQVIAVRWKQPRARAKGSRLDPILPADCGQGEPQSVLEGTGLVSTWTLECRGSLVGKSVGVAGIAGSGADVVLRIVLEDGRTLIHVLKADRPEYLVPERQSALAIVTDYVGVGIEHILSGWDHLLFVLGLVLLVGRGRTLLWTITAFTLGHSITLALAVLGFVKFPPQPIEALIAFSIYLLAIELARRQSHRKTFMDRMPWIVAGSFGLLHGLGFAGALREVGLPEGEIPLALFAFNVGIELGQLAFVALVLCGWGLVRAVPFRWPEWTRYVPAYGIGTLAAYWFFQRLSETVGI
jgi:hydrogenase/urease accessory protein HupE